MWENASEAIVVGLAAGASAITDLSPTAQGAVRERDVGLVAVRELGNIEYSANNAAGSARLRVSAGIAVVTSDSFAAGATSLPRPDIANPQWLWNRTEGFDYQTDQGIVSKTIEIDSHAQRKIAGLDRLLMFIVRNLSGVSIDVVINIRVLFRLP